LNLLRKNPNTSILHRDEAMFLSFQPRLS